MKIYVVGNEILVDFQFIEVSLSEPHTSRFSYSERYVNRKS